MPKSPLPKSCRTAKPFFEGKKVDLYTVNGREFVIHAGAVVMLPLLSENELILIRNERMVVDEWLWELPAGTLEPGEHPSTTAHRELIEEIGYQATDIQRLFDFYSSPGFCNEKITAYVARNLTFVGQKLDPSENIKTEMVSWDKALSMIKEGQIHDGKTIATLLYYNQFYA